MKYAPVAILLVLAASRAAEAQIARCQNMANLALPKNGDLGAMEYVAPPGHNRVELLDKDGLSVNPVFQRAITNGRWTVNTADWAAIRSAAYTAAKPLRLRWSGGNNATARPCDTGLIFDGEPEPRPQSSDLPGLVQEWSSSDCANAGTLWQEEIRAERKKRGLPAGSFTQLIFLEGEGVCFANRDYGVEGDPIYVGVFTDEPDAWNGVSATFEPCARESEAPNIRVTGELPSVLSGEEALVFTLRRYLPRRCFNEVVDVTISSRNGDTQQAARYNLSQAKRYRAGYQLGVNFTNLHDRTFGLRLDSTVIDKGPSEKGPDYFASMVFYSVLKYAQSLGGGESYPGRDVIHDNDLLHRLGLTLGAGIRNPLDRFVGGIVFEILPGISVSRAYEFAKIKTLDGVGVGDKFSGPAESLPLRLVWRRGWTTGIAIDLRYATKLFK